jgi:hypothetical protein
MSNPNQTIAQSPLFCWVEGLGRVIVVAFLWVTFVMVELTGDPLPARPLTYIILWYIRQPSIRMWTI